MIDKKYADYAWEMAEKVLAIDSPSGYTEKASTWLKDAFTSLGFSVTLTQKGGVLVDFGGEKENDG